MRLRTALALSENEELLRNFKGSRRCVPIDGIVRPADRTTDFAGGARVAAEPGDEASRGDAAGREVGAARYGVNLTVITSPSVIT